MVGIPRRRTQETIKERQQVNIKQKLALIGVGLATVLAFAVFFMAFNWEVVEGNERLITQNWNTGVSEEVLSSGTHFYIPLTTNVYKYNVGTEKFIMGDKKYYNGVGSDYVDYPAYTITTGGSGNEQPATFSVTLQYHLDPTKLVALHNQAQQNYEDLVIKPALTRIISDQATQLKVLDFYSGTGRVELQNTIREAITEHPALASVGIIVDTFVFDAIVLDDAYVGKIQARQLAYQDKLKNIEEAKAAKELAKKVEAEAEANKLKLIVEAEAKKQQKIKAAEAANESKILAAKAAAEQKRLDASAERYRKEQDAKGALALGLAEAKVLKEKRDSRYSGVSGQRQAAVEIEQARVELFKNMAIKGIVTEKTALTIINGNAVNNPMLTVPATKPAH
jgi:regulator of protease activity HflC (stomatin/prohibitin superfamily)